jgi:hypothetical protein
VLCHLLNSSSPYGLAYTSARLCAYSYVYCLAHTEARLALGLVLDSDGITNTFVQGVVRDAADLVRDTAKGAVKVVKDNA